WKINIVGACLATRAALNLIQDWPRSFWLREQLQANCQAAPYQLQGGTNSQACSNVLDLPAALCVKQLCQSTTNEQEPPRGWHVYTGIV
ncbi:MAG: hypothetical protein ACKPKO_29595, partial [Candidatus Fonsibacter sp.]